MNIIYICKHSSLLHCKINACVKYFYVMTSNFADKNGLIKIGQIFYNSLSSTEALAK